MAGGVNALPQLQGKTDANNALVVTLSGGQAKADSLVMDATNADTVLVRATSGAVALYATGAAATAAANGIRVMNGTNAGTALEYGGASWVSNFFNVGTVTNGGTPRNVRVISASSVVILAPNGADAYVFATGGPTTFAGVAATGLGVPVIVAFGRSVAATAAIASLMAYTVGAADASFEISANMNVTTATAIITNLQVNYTDEFGVAKNMIMPVAQLAGSFIAGGAITTTGAWESPALHIRCKQTTVITALVQTGTFTGANFNAEAILRRLI